MKLCIICRRQPTNSRTSSRCTACHRAYCRRHYGSRRVTTRTKALAWLRVPRTTRQLAALLAITPQHAATQVWQLRRRGLVEAVDRPMRGQPCRYRVMP